MIDKIVIFTLLLYLIFAIVFLYLYLQDDNGSKKKEMKYVGGNNCIKTVVPEDDSNSYDSQQECQKSENVRDGYKLVNAPGHEKQCLNSKNGQKCEKGTKNCNCYQNKVCVKTSDKPNEWGKKENCKIGDGDCFLTEYGCWNTLNKYKWKCSIRGDGCDYVQCDPGDKSCFNTEKQCLNRCKSYCSEDNACVQTVDCVPYGDGDEYRTINKSGKIRKKDPCFSTIKDCSKKCKNVECRKSIFDKDSKKACRFSVCDDTDLECLKSKTDKVFKKCAEGTCVPYKCNSNEYLPSTFSSCSIADGVSGARCNPDTDDKCYIGDETCTKECEGAKNLYLCDQGICRWLGGNTQEERAQLCKNRKCFSSYEFCDQCTDSQPGYTCWDNCDTQVMCPVYGENSITSGGCYNTPKECNTACLKRGNLSKFFDGKCIKLDKDAGCDLIKDENCYQDMTKCQYDNGLPFT